MKSAKINQLLASIPKGIVLTTPWLQTKGYSSDLLKRYRSSGWLESIGVGADIRAGDSVEWSGALHTLQAQTNLQIHVGARSALATLGKSHYLELDTKKVVLFFPHKSKVPAWFKRHNWEVGFEYHYSDFIPPEMGLSEVRIREYDIKVSNEIRAMMECLYLAPRSQELTECYELMESMNNIHPKKVQELLEHCNSVKVKRLFLCLAEKIGHDWFSYLELSKVDLGKGKRSFVKNGVLDKKYQITVPQEWSNND